MTQIHRRMFLGGAALSGSAALAAASSSFPALHRARRPSDEIRVAVVGIRSRGQHHIRSFHGLPDARVVAVCDVDESLLLKERAKFAERGESLDTYADLRVLLARDDIDAISLATPNHLHALHTIWACQAGKDVYCEKPISHNVFEGRQAVIAAAKYGRVVATGTQARSSTAIQQGIEWMHAGNLGPLTYAWGTCYKPRKSIGKVPNAQEIPGNMAWDLWCGPRGVMPLMRQQLHYDWHWQFATGCGDLGNQGIHQMDICRWGLGRKTLAPRVLSVGGRFGYDDDGDTPNTQFLYFDYEPAPLIFEVRGLPANKEAQTKNWGGGMDRRNGMGIGVSIHAEGGYLAVSNSYASARAYDDKGQLLKEWKGGDDHFAGFIAAVKAQDSTLLASDILEGHLSSALCHMGNDSHRLGWPTHPDSIADAVSGEPHLNTSWERMQAHLVANAVDLKRTPAQLGRWLVLDQETELYVGDSEANVLRRGSYAEGFEVTDEV
ncbi:MAG: putative dehydrogenase [Planctomycetota bacterium]|jgi:predicted dehydrogenase